jgi:hypothetical protein
MKNRLSLKVKAVNTANTYAKYVYPLLHDYFKQYVGQKIDKADGSLLKKIADNLPNLKIEDRTEDGCHVSFMTYRNSSNYTLSYTAKVCVSNGDGCAYQEVTVYIGDYKHCLLENVRYEEPNRRTDYTAEEIVEARKKIEDAKKVVSELERAVYEFGMYDN